LIVEMKEIKKNCCWYR